MLSPTRQAARLADILDAAPIWANHEGAACGFLSEDALRTAMSLLGVKDGDGVFLDVAGRPDYSWTAVPGGTLSPADPDEGLNALLSQVVQDLLRDNADEECPSCGGGHFDCAEE